MPPRAWSVRAINLPEHADNPIHTDVGAQAAGFPRALVAGVTTYAVLTRPVVADEPSWIERGAGEVRFVSPVFDGDEIHMTPSEQNGIWTVAANVNGSTKATLRLLDAASVSAELAAVTTLEAEPLSPIVVPLTQGYADYGTRAGDDLALYVAGIVHPSIWLKLANRMFAEQLVDGSWVHTRSRFIHRSSANVGDSALVTGAVFRRFSTPAGERAVALLNISVDGLQIADIEHEAIVSVTRKD